MEQPDQILHNAQNGIDKCNGCDAQVEQQGEYVNPGLFNPTSDLVFMTDEPRHLTNWNEYDSWSEYNEYRSKRIAKKGRKLISELLEPFDYTIHDIWMGDSIKCPTNAKKWDIPSASTTDAFNHCRSYLTDELRTGEGGGDRRLVVTLGTPAAQRTHKALGVPKKEAEDIGVEKDYGHSEFNTTPPIVICPHWNAQIFRSEFIPVVQDAMADILN